MVTCRDDAGRPVSWSGPRGPLGTKTHPAVEVSSFGTSLVFMPIAKDDGGMYKCKVQKNAVGTEMIEFQLGVEVPLTFMDTPPVQKGKESTNVTLRCEVKGGDKPVLTWTSEGKELLPPKYEQIGDGLVIRDVTRADSRTYTCRAMQPSTGSIRDQNITLKVEHKPVPRHPHLWKKVDQAWGFVGGTVNLTCEVEANPPPKIEWYRKGHPIVMKDRNNEADKSILTLHINNSKVFGEYKCKVSNALGKLEKIIALDQGVQPKPPDLIYLQEANSNTLKLSIHGPEVSNETLSLGMEPVGFRVRYKALYENTDWNRANYVDFPIEDDKSYLLEELLKDTDYEVQVATKNIAGISGFTDITVYKTAKSSAQGFLLRSYQLVLVYVTCPIAASILL